MTPSEAPDPLEELVGIHEHLRHAMICFFQRRRVPDAEELAAEVFLRVLRKLRKGLRIHSSVEHYCWRVARFVSLEQARRRQTEELSDAMSADSASPLGLFPIESTALYRQCMDLLSAADVEFVQRYLYEDKRALAAELDTNPGAMATRFCKLKRRLEKSLGLHTGKSRK